MSLILEALNRSRDSSDAIPTLSTRHPVESVHAGVRPYVPWIVLSVALVLMAWLLWNRLSGEPVTPPDAGSPVAELTQNIGSAATSITTELKARAEAREKELEPPAVNSPPEKEQSAATAIAKTTPEPLGAVTEQPAPAVDEAEPAGQPPRHAAVEPEPQNASPSATEDPAVARLYRDRSVPEEPPSAPVERAPAANREEKPLDIQNVLERAQEEMGNTGLDEHPVPFLSSLSQQTKNEVPTLYYQKHDYSSDAGKSRVTLNGKTVREGGSPAPGFKVEEILPNSVVLNYRGTQFRLRALNSWINL